jgi:clorobiocin biosynthesis protein CloN6
MTEPIRAWKKPGMTFPDLQADLVLLHAPAFFDFRGRRDIYFPFLGTSGDVPITSLYEYFPLGFKTLQRFLTERSFSVTLINLATVLLRFPEIDVDTLLGAIRARLLGIDLHWMVHVQGSLAVAERIKRVQPGLPIILGGISATYYARELIQYPFVDMVMRGYDTHEPLADLLGALQGGGDLSRVPNLLWKSAGGRIHENAFSHKPRTFSCGIDWSVHPKAPSTDLLPIKELLSTQNAGCSNNCGWCGGSHEAFRRVFEYERAMVRKQPAEIDYEFQSMRALEEISQYHFYAVGSYNESRKGMESFLDRVGEAGFKSVSYEQFHLTPEPILRRMIEANRRTTITLSPESHDIRISKLAGRGVYSNEALEAWLEQALEIGVYNVDIWYFIGMPEQDARSVADTVAYCERLLEKFRSTKVNPIICPMIPYLDPASTFFEHPDRHGYRVIYRTAEEHRRGMERASIINRINYETRWLSRTDLVHVGFKAVRDLMEAKASSGVLPRSWVNRYNAQIDDALTFIPVVHAADELRDPAGRAEALAGLGDEIERRNQAIFFSGVMNQSFPINRQIGGRWFDELGWSEEVLEGVLA